MNITLTGFDLTWEQVCAALNGAVHVSVTQEAQKKIEKSRQFVEQKLSEGKAIYGINTGFGKLATTTIPKDQLAVLQKNLLFSHAVGVGNRFPKNISRLALLLRTQALVQGFSGVRFAIVERLVEMLNKDVIPCMPEKGSVGASGDLAPLAHMALTLIGEGELWDNQKLEKPPLVLEAKEGLSLVNGTQISLAVACAVLQKTEYLLKLADINVAMAVEGDRASHQPFSEEVVSARPHPGALRTAANIRKLLAGSEIAQSHADCPRVQDPYSFRCVPQVHGVAKEAHAKAKETLAIEWNSATDNPLVFAEPGKILHGGNFHGAPIGYVIDSLAIALATLGSIAERRVAKLTDPNFLSPEPGLNSGFMIPHVVMSALVSENKILASPASVDSIPTSGGQEDHVSMSLTASTKALKIAKHLETILSIELLATAQALDLIPRRPKGGAGVEAVHRALREKIPFISNDLGLRPSLEKTYRWVEAGGPISVAEDAVGMLQV